MKKNNQQDIVNYLIAIISMLAATALALFYIYVPENKNNRWHLLMNNMIPGAVLALISVPTIYIIFTTKGINISQNDNNDNIDKNNINQLKRYIDMRQNRCIDEFNDYFYDCPWKEWINGSRTQIDIVVYYFDSWLKNNRKELVKFLKHKDSKINFIVCNPNKEENIKYIRQLFPDNSESFLKEKIQKTKTLLESIAKEANASQNGIKFYYSERPLSYSIQRFDNKKVALSVFEMFREHEIGSPVMLIDLKDSEKISNFIEKEIDGLIKVSEESDI